MQRAMRNGELISQGYRPLSGYGVIPQCLAPRKPHHNTATVAVSYRDGTWLTFLFDRSTPIADLMAMISRAGRVRKVVV